MAPHAGQVLDFWFGEGAERGRVRDLWFRKSEAFDREVEARFGARVAQALEGGLADWAVQPEGTLALVLLLDQFTRNIYRGQPRAFAGDARALALARGLVDAGQDQSMLPVQRVFVYLPFEHAEDLATQEESLRLFTRLQQSHPEHQGFLDYAQRHHEVIAQFGRFPHRNAILGRASTDKEKRFLAQPGSGF